MTERRRAEDEYRSSYRALWRSAQVAGVVDVLTALERFQKAAVALSLTRPEPVGPGYWGSDDVVKGWPAALPPCPLCGGLVPRKSKHKSGPQRAYCSARCMKAAVARRHRERRGAAQPVRVRRVPAARVATLDRSCVHTFVVLPGHELARLRGLAGWPAHMVKHLDRGRPHLVCATCLRTYHRLRYSGPVGAHVAAHVPAHPTLGNGGNGAMRVELASIPFSGEAG